MEDISREDIDASLERESDFDIPAFDGKKIFVRLNKSGNKPSKKAVVIGHGLTGRPEEALHQIARDYFNDRGYDVYRLAYYHDDTGYRRLHETTLDIHAKDLNTVLGHVRGSHEKVFVIGHSHGGLTMVFANPQANALCFWDPSYQPGRRWVINAQLSHDGRHYERTGRFKFAVGIDAIEEVKKLTREAAKEMAEKITAPSLVVVAEDSWLGEDPNLLFDDLTCEKGKVRIKGADHIFSRGKTAHDLVQKTYAWFERV
ncbi:MAG: alpha/beta hydrolase [Pseudobdellovibrionaceae bacterium]|jgi:esterase/lipase|nr:alpha/beta hydrolase [Pseudobdellovibrionaceae bacterium]